MTALMEIVEPAIFGLFTFDCFTEEFCTKFVDELDHLAASGAKMIRPNR